MGAYHLRSTNYDLMGFYSVKEFAKTALGYYGLPIILFFGFATGTILFGVASVNEWISNWVYNPASVVLLIMFGLVVDWASAVYPAWMEGRFETEKAKRLGPVMFSHLFLFLMIHYGFIVFVEPLKEDVFLLYESVSYFKLMIGMYIFGISFISAIGNAGRAGLIDNRIVRYVLVHVDRWKQITEAKEKIEK